MKKLVCLALALALVLGMASFSFASAEGEYTKLTWVTGDSPAPIDNAAVLEEMNKITREKLGVEVDIIYMSNDEVQLANQSGEVYDMYYTCSWYNYFLTNVSNGFFANIWGKVQEWTPDLWAIMPEEVWNLARSTDGGLYAIPVKKDYAKMQYIGYDAQFAQDNGFEIPDYIESWDEMTPYMEALQAAMKEDPTLGTYALPLAGGVGAITSDFDFIDRVPEIGTEYGDTKVISVLEDPSSLENWHVVREWYQKGLINPDAPTATSVKTEHGVGFIQAWTGYDWTPGRGHWTKLTQFSGPLLSTDGVQGAMNAFSITLEDDPERFELAMKYQELVNTDRDLRDILAYGIPGEHFNYVEVTDDSGITDKVAIRTEKGTSNYNPWRFAQGSYELCSIEASQGMVDGTYPKPVLDQWAQYFKLCEDAEVSAISGFTFDNSAFETEYAQITAIKSKYNNDLNSGAVDIDETIAKMLDEENAVGLQDIIAEAQAQLDAYLASK